MTDLLWILMEAGEGAGYTLFGNLRVSNQGDPGAWEISCHSVQFMEHFGIELEVVRLTVKLLTLVRSRRVVFSAPDGRARPSWAGVEGCLVSRRMRHPHSLRQK